MARQATRFVAVLDSETVNARPLLRSLPVSYQLGICLSGVSESLSPNDVRTVLARDASEVYRELDDIVETFADTGETPVVGVHNLAYDIHFLMPYINSMHEKGYLVDCCFKSSIKPLTVSFKQGDSTELILWDTLSFSGKSLAKMGRECGYLKKSGDWDYSVDRTPATPLTDEEVGYALADVVVPFMWLKWWHGLNPEVPLDQLAMPVLTKTSVVRYKCKELGMGVEEYGKPVYERFLGCCKSELPKTEVDYDLMIRSTSAGWTFTAGANAGRDVLDAAMKYDATSMHPSHMVSHLYPYDFEQVSGKTAQLWLDQVMRVTLEDAILRWRCPFPRAFNARVMFTNLRPKAGSIFERDDLMLHGSALFSDYSTDADKETESSDMEFNAVNAAGYSNVAVNGRYSFGKLVSADLCIISLNELNAWVHAQVYDWDSCQVLAMSGTEKFRRPPEYVMLSVGTMLGRKKIVKDAMHGSPPEVRPDWVPEEVYQGMLGYSEHGSESVDSFYKQVKADLNSLYGMFATNEAKQSMVYSDGDFKYDGVRGFDKLPAKPKAWYNFGLRIAAWSRVQQCCAMLLLDAGGVAQSFVNGDTDSFCFRAERPGNDAVMGSLAPLHAAIERSMREVMAVPELPPQFEGLGLYMVDCEPGHYCAVANKRYAYTTGAGDLHVASAGVPNRSVEYALQSELDAGESFEAATIYALGYLATYGADLSGTKYKAQPEYPEVLEKAYTMVDYLDRPYTYLAGTPVGIYLDEAEKTLGEGYADDYARCLANSGVAHRGLHRYTREDD